jgi:hypothetical protein
MAAMIIPHILLFAFILKNSSSQTQTVSIGAKSRKKCKQLSIEKTALFLKQYGVFRQKLSCSCTVYLLVK